MKNIKGYAWRNEHAAALYHATAEQAHEAFEEIRHREGKLTPAAVVDSARPKESVLHEDFEWRDDVAAEKFRQGQARQMIGAVRILRVDSKPPVRAYVNVTVTSSPMPKATDCIRKVNERQELPTIAEEENEGRCYMPLEEVLQSPSLCSQMMADARRDAQTYKQKYSTLESLADIMQAIQRTFGEDEPAKNDEEA